MNREHFPSHLTVSTWLTNAEGNKALLMHHPKLKRWIPVGDHLIPDDVSIEAASKRILKESTGYRDATWKDGFIMDLDIHQVPRSDSEPEHNHFDIRLWFVANSEQLPNTPVKNIMKWVNFDEIHKLVDQESVLRMAFKTMEA